MPPIPTPVYVSGADLISAVAAESNEELASGLARGLRPDVLGPGEIPRPPGRVRAPPGVSRRRGDLARVLDRRALRGLDAERSGLCPCRGEGLGHPSPRRLAVRGRDLLRQGAARWPTWPPPRATACSATRPRCIRCASWPTSPAPRLSWPGRLSFVFVVEHDGRFLRFNDAYRTISAQLPADSYAETKAHIDAQLEQIPSEGATPLDQRRCDVLLGLLRSAVPGSTGSPTATTTASPYVVVAHVPLAALVEDSGEESALAGELEHGGLIDIETMQRIACDATVVVALDDDARAHHVRGPGPEVRHRYPAPRGDAPGPPVSLPGLHQHDLHQCPPRRTVETPGPHRPRQPRAHLLVPPPSGAQQGLDHVGQRQRGAHLHRPERAGS